MVSAVPGANLPTVSRIEILPGRPGTRRARPRAASPRESGPESPAAEPQARSSKALRPQRSMKARRSLETSPMARISAK